ncbi:acyl carrier protein [Streptomyces sp. enrichment culture]|uniref:acyl carrier protein n=1 Tax=Streptomyces sp. enrichment culture TaxID=1795815 RepID=UPI003F57244F
MSAFTLDDLFRIIRSATGEPLDSAPPEELQDTAFGDLGVDSLALLETATRVELETGVAVPESEVPELSSPRLFHDYVVQQLKESA